MKQCTSCNRDLMAGDPDVCERCDLDRAAHAWVTSHTDTDWHAWCPTCGWADSIPVSAYVGREHEITAAFTRLHNERTTP